MLGNLFTDEEKSESTEYEKHMNNEWAVKRETNQKESGEFLGHITRKDDLENIILTGRI